MAKILQILDVDSAGHKVSLDDGRVIVIPHGGDHPIVGQEIAESPTALELENGRLKAEIENWKAESQQQCNNAQFYRGLVVRIGEMFGVEARTSDDGSIQEDVLCLKVPELVERLKTENADLKDSLKKSVDLMIEAQAGLKEAQAYADDLSAEAAGQRNAQPEAQ